MHQIPLKYEKGLFNQIKKLKASFFDMSNTHIMLILNRKVFKTFILFYLNL